MIQLVIIEDDDVIRRNLISFAGFQDDIEVVKDFNSIESFKKGVSKIDNAPHVILLDIGLPGMSGVDGIPIIKEHLPDIDIIMLTTYEEEDMIVKAMRAGACSYLSKRTTLEKIMESIRIVYEGGSYMSPNVARNLTKHIAHKNKIDSIHLSPKQKEVMEGITEGLSYKEMAERMDISIETVRTHIKRIYKQLHVNSKGEAIKKYLKR